MRAGGMHVSRRVLAAKRRSKLREFVRKQLPNVALRFHPLVKN